MAIAAWVPLAALDNRVLTAIVVAGGLVLFAGLLIVTAIGELRGRRKAKVPPAFRPGPGDEELERRVLERYLAWGAVATILMAIWLPAYWLFEPDRLERKRARFEHLHIFGHEGELRDGGAQLYADFCLRCHGEEGAGTIQQFTIDGEERQYAEPPLAFIYARYKATGRSEDEITQLIRDAIDRGRPGTPMPTWGFAFGGPLNSFQVDNLIKYIKYLNTKHDAPTAPPGATGAQLFEENCAVCHGPNGEGGVGPNLTVALERLTERQLRGTIANGRVNVNRPSMPSWAFLGEDAINALVEFVKSIQRGGR